MRRSSSAQLSSAQRASAEENQSDLTAGPPLPSRKPSFNRRTFSPIDVTPRAVEMDQEDDCEMEIPDFSMRQA